MNKKLFEFFRIHTEVYVMCTITGTDHRDNGRMIKIQKDMFYLSLKTTILVFGLLLL